MQRFSLEWTWTVSQICSDDEIPVNVPGTVHLDLLAAGRIDDPYYRDHEDALQWISEVSWLYRRRFMIDDDLLQHARVLLRCFGLDTLASIAINGKCHGHALLAT